MKPNLALMFLALFAMVGFGAIAPVLFSDSFTVAKVDELPEIATVPEFSLIDAGGSAFNSTSLHDNFLIVNFFFTSCEGPCPRMSANMAKLHEQLKTRSDVKMLSISIDPERDTPAKIAEYAKRFSADGSRWHFLTGDKEAIYQLALSGFKLAAVEDGLIHSTKFVLVDKKRQIRGYYDGTESAELQRLVGDLGRLYDKGV